VWPAPSNVLTGADAESAEEALSEKNQRSPDFQDVGRVNMNWNEAVGALSGMAAHINGAAAWYWPLSSNSNSVAFQGAETLGFSHVTPMQGHEVPAVKRVFRRFRERAVCSST
jgi:hypothetical protein